MEMITILTGATGAIGRELAAFLAEKKEGILLLACRNTAKADELRNSVAKLNPRKRIATARLDLADEESVHEFCALPMLQNMPVTVMNNAGVMRRTYAADAKGREITLAVNFFNTRLLTELLLQHTQLRRAVFTTSLTRFLYRPFSRKAEVSEREFHQLRTYGLSKRLITDYAATLRDSGRCEVACADPGVVNTGMIKMQRWYDSPADVLFRPLIRTPRQGSVPAQRALTLEPGYIYCAHRRHSLKGEGDLCIRRS